MLSEQQQRIMGYFIEEAKDHLNTIEQGLLNLQNTIADPEMVNEMFRAAHSVKGGAAMLGLNGIQQTSHRLEDYFKVLKECPIQVDQKLETLFLRVFDTLQELLEHLQGPFGLTDDKAEEVMSDVMPVFIALNEHLGQLVSQCGSVPPEDVDLGLEQPVTAAAVPAMASKAQQPVSEESALRLVFQSDVPVQLREMLGLFKQTDQPASREQLQSVCRNLTQAGEQFELSRWCELLELARRAIAHSDNSYRTLAPTVIKDIKQAQELVLSGRSVEISCSESLRALLPTEPEPAEALDDLADLLASADFDRSDRELELPDFALDADNAPLTAAESTEPDNLFDQDDSWFSEATSSESTYVDESTFIQAEGTLADADLGFGEPALEYGDSGADLNLSQSPTRSRFADHMGPEVGAAELNSLADLFEGEVPDLGMTWQEEVVIVDTAGEFPDALDADASSDFSDLLFDQDTLDEDLSLQTETQADDDLSGLLNSSELFGDSSEMNESPTLTELNNLMNETSNQPEDEPTAHLTAETADSELSLDFLESEFESSEIASDADSFAEVEVDESDTPSSLPNASNDLDNLTELFADLNEDFAAESSDPFSLNQLEQAFTAEEPELGQPAPVPEPFAQIPDPFADEGEFLEFLPTDQADPVLALNDVDLNRFELDDFSLDAREAAGDRPSSESTQSSDSAQDAQDWEVLQDSSSDDSLIEAFLHDDTSVTAAAQPSEDLLMELPMGEDLLMEPETPIETPTDDASLFSLTESKSALAVDSPSPAQTASAVSDPWDEEFEEFTQPQGQLQPTHDFTSDDDFFDSFSGMSIDQSPELQNEADLFADPFDNSIPPQPATSSPELAAATGLATQSEPELDLDAVEDEAISQAFDHEEILDAPAMTDAPASQQVVAEELFVEGFIIDQSEDEFASETSDFGDGFVSTESSDFVEGFIFDSSDAEETEPETEFDGLFGTEANLSVEPGFDRVTGQEEAGTDLENLFGEEEAIAPSPVFDLQDSDLSAPDSSEIDETLFDLGTVEESTEPRGFSETLFDLTEATDLDFDLDAETAEAADFNLNADLNAEETEDLSFSLDAESNLDVGFNLNAKGIEELDLNLDVEIPESLAALDEAMLGLDANSVDGQQQDFSAVFGEESELNLAAETPAAQDTSTDEAFSFEDLTVGEDADMLNEAAFDFDLFGANDELTEQAIAHNETTDTPTSESDLDIGDLSFGSETDLEEIAGAPETSEITEAGDFTDLDELLGDTDEVNETIALNPELNAIESADFADLDALLEFSEPAGSVSDSATEPLQGDFTGLDALLEGQVAEPISLDFDASSSEMVDDFADLDALLGDNFTASSLSADATSQEVEVIDEFDDLEKLLEDADQTLGGPPTSKSARRPPLAPSRRNSRRGGGVLSDQTMRVSVKNLDNLNNLVGELVVNRNSLEQGQERLRQFLDNLLYQVQQLSDVGQRMRDLYERSLLESSLLSNRKSYHLPPPDNGGSTLIQSSHSTGLSFDALEMDRFTGFHTLSQEMIELIVRVRESASDINFVVDETDQVTRMFRQVTTQLQEGLTRSRMVPFAQTADRLPRAVRDISLKCGKQAELTVEGRETLIDKMILEQLYDPMTHLVNNAITHGIETPEERIAARKSPVGRITVRTFHQGNQTVISVTDDGAGINPQKVKAKALEKGLITPAESREMTELDVYDLLFHHGFSTKDRADDLSGRGIGMDVVQTSLNEIRGVINIDSTVGIGTTFTIRLPLTLSISKALCCISNHARIAFPMDGVEDMLDVPKERIQTDSEGRSCILWRDTLLPFQPLSELLKYNRSLGRGSVYGGNQEEDIVSVVVLRSAGNFLALQVDQVLGEQEIVIKQLEGPVPKPVGVAGATVLGDGRIMPIADVLELIDLSIGRIRREAGNALWEKEQEPPVEAPVLKTDPTVLIVDDSITVRELLSMTFNKVGYRVEQARDGQEAWEKLRSGLPCDLVFCDIEMPRMDGLELLSRIQKDPNLAHLPIAMLTSRGADRHRQMAIQLGAKGYFTKPYLEEALLDAAQRMLKGEVLVGGDS